MNLTRWTSQTVLPYTKSWNSRRFPYPKRASQRPYPLYGRYNPKVSPVENINLPAALLSRFDLLFLILDKPSRDDDERLAEHVTHVHMFNEHPTLEYEPVDPNIMRSVEVPSMLFRGLILA
jgi:DNA replicative helicase MCM subunit Mcm2 (Cdc46/Mcm family)